MAAAALETSANSLDKQHGRYVGSEPDALPRGTVERQAMKCLLERLFPEDGASVGSKVGILLQAFPNIKLVIQEKEWRADRLSVGAVWQGTHLGSLNGYGASGRDVKFRTTLILQVKSGKIVHRWGTVDMQSLAKQLTTSQPGQAVMKQALLSTPSRPLPSNTKGRKALAAAMNYQGI